MFNLTQIEDKENYKENKGWSLCRLDYIYATELCYEKKDTLIYRVVLHVGFLFLI